MVVSTSVRLVRGRLISGALAIRIVGVVSMVGTAAGSRLSFVGGGGCGVGRPYGVVMADPGTLLGPEETGRSARGRRDQGFCP